MFVLFNFFFILAILGTCSNAGDLIIWDLSRGMSQSKSISLDSNMKAKIEEGYANRGLIKRKK